MSVQSELEARPTQEDFEEKIKQCNTLRTELTDLTEQMACNEKLLEQLQLELTQERELYKSMMEKCLTECGVQTDIIESTKQDYKIDDEVPAKVTQATLTDAVDAVTPVSVLSVSTSTTTTEDAQKKDDLLTQSEEVHMNTLSQADLPQFDQTLDESKVSSPITEKDKLDKEPDDIDDDELNNHPKVLYEDELIVFKEKCRSLTEDNIRLQREVAELRSTMSNFHSNWLHNFMLKYLVPVIILFIAYFFYLCK